MASSSYYDRVKARVVESKIGESWSQDEMDVVSDGSFTVLEIAELTGRSYSAIYRMKRKMNRDIIRSMEMENVSREEFEDFKRMVLEKIEDLGDLKPVRTSRAYLDEPLMDYLRHHKNEWCDPFQVAANIEEDPDPVRGRLGVLAANGTISSKKFGSRNMYRVD